MSNSIEEKKAKINEYVNEYLTDVQVDYITDLINLWNSSSYKALMKLADTERRTFDTATPEPYMAKIREIYPNIDKGRFIYDYTDKSFGELVNVNDLVVSKMLATCK